MRLVQSSHLSLLMDPWTMKKPLLLCCLMGTLLAGSALSGEKPVPLAVIKPDSRTGQAETSNPWVALNPKRLTLASESALVVDSMGNEVYAKRIDEPRSIASITKLMTAMVVLDAALAPDERITITRDDRDLIRYSGSRLQFGTTLTRDQLLRLALMASENRAANALARTCPGGRKAFVQAMNKKARAIGMTSSRFADPAGLDSGNVATARDMVKMVRAAQKYPLIREATTTGNLRVYPYKGKGELRFNNTNRLLKNAAWQIQLSKTGYINEAGRCLVMQASIADQPLVIVLLNSFGKLTPFGDSNRIRKWIESGDRGVAGKSG
jgi:D-alanyl-D-alanine endopeptidase (penicillin-binding protein 7)